MQQQSEVTRQANFKGSTKGANTWRGKGGKKAGGKRLCKTAREQAAEYKQSFAWADSEQVVRDSAVATFLRGLGVESHPLHLDGDMFFRNKSLVSYALALPLKIAKKARHGLASASHGGLRSVVFFELPMVARAQRFEDTPESGSHLFLDDSLQDQIRVAKLDNKTSKAMVVVNSQQETEEAVTDVDAEVRRLVADTCQFLMEQSQTDALESSSIGNPLMGRGSTRLDTSGSAIASHCRIADDLSARLLSKMQKQRDIHNCFERLLNRLSLDFDEGSECRRRGLHPQIADRCLLRTWNGGVFRGVPIINAQGEMDSISIRLPAGMFIPARNVEGLICGLQFRLRTTGNNDEEIERRPTSEEIGAHVDSTFPLTESQEACEACFKEDIGSVEEPTRRLAQPKKKSPKYIWVSKDKSVKGDSGVVPFFCVCPRWSCREHTVALVEGGLKAYAFAFLARRFPVIGAAGGQWYQCGEPLLHALARLSSRRVLLFADAGAVLNRSVLLDYLRSLRLLALDWGVEVKFVWWEQDKKGESLDCDDQLLALRKEGRFSCDTNRDSHAQGAGDVLVEDDGSKLQTKHSSKVATLEAAMLHPSSFWAKVSDELRTNLTRDKRSRLLVQSLQPLLDESLSAIPLTHRRR